MTQIKDLEEIVGKTIKSVYRCDNIVLVFTDDTYLNIEIEDTLDESFLSTTDTLGMYTRELAGIITKAEYEEYQTKEAVVREQARQAQEIEQLARLKEKYEGKAK